MGLLIDGTWRDKWYDTESTGGKFKRQDSIFRNWVTANGAAGPSGKRGFKAEPGRYHLYVSYACPWAHRTLIFRKLKGLEDAISVSVVHWLMLDNGWTFAEGDGVIPASVNGAEFMHQLYTKAVADYSGRVTVPVLWDKHTSAIVSNESSEIIRMFNSAFDSVGAKSGDYYPVSLRGEIDELIARIYPTVNNGVYKAGFATTQGAYEEAGGPLFDSLDWLEERLTTRRFLSGDRTTEADWRLFTTLLRFDPVYYSHFKCNLRQLRDYSNLWGYVRDLYQSAGLAETVNMDHIKRHYYQSQITVNPTQVT
ncbi:MAG: glutathione S-transferase family protein, partial [Cyanophyceae cyanobacterium]